jgi:hypothetical protein
MSTTTDGTPAAAPDVGLTDGFRLPIDALKFNGWASDQAAGHLPDGVGDRRHLRREGENISLIALRASKTSTSAVVVRVAADVGADAGAAAG